AMRNIDFAFPAGYESDASNDDWDIEPEGNNTSNRKVAFHQFLVETRAVPLLIVKFMILTGMDVETKLSYGWTPLMCAVSLANYNLAKLLLDRGASANFSKDHWTVLMASCSASASEDKIVHCVELLLSRSADPNMVDRSQITCLMMAAREGYSKLVNLLVSHGAAINTQDSKGYTALAIAVQYGREEVVLKLLQLGADKTIRTKNGKSPADLARMFQHRRVNATKLDEVQLLLHGLNLGHLADIMTLSSFPICQIGITDPEDQQKVLSAVQQMQLNKVDLDKIQLVIEENGNEELLNFLLSVSHQCSYLTEILQDTSSRFPRQTSQLILSMDPKKEAQSVCSQLVLQTKDLQKEVTCLYSLLCQVSMHVNMLLQIQSKTDHNRSSLLSTVMNTDRCCYKKRHTKKLSHSNI
uniref:Ankyrin repeat, SAM and basic leucine zipper domain containing 1 n=1 Tax=Cyprinodon variegatus TaxID=28743 RepID=A0A3Q2FPA2_CYPVA